MQFVEQRKNPTVAVLLSFLISGGGQIYNGEVGKGVGMIAAYIFCLAASALVLPILIAVVLWVWGMIDADKRAKEFNEELKNRLYKEELSEKEAAEQQERIRSTMVGSKEFVAQVEKCFKLFQNGLLSETEFEAKKKEAIVSLAVKTLCEEPEDFLTAIIPLLQKKALTDREIDQIKAAVL